MGYEISCRSSDVRIARKHEKDAMAAIIAAARKKAFADFGLGAGDVVAMMRAKSLDTLLEKFFYVHVSRDEDDRIEGLDFESGSYGDTIEILLNILAPFVRKGSWMEIRGEDGATWHYRFDGESVEEDWTTGDDSDE